MANRERESRLQTFEREALTHLDVLLRTAFRIMRPLSEAEDVVQETFLRAWKHFDSFERGSNCRGWLFRIMFNVINDKKGKQAKRSEAPLDEDSGFADERSNVLPFDPLKKIEGQELLDATNRLSEEHRTVLWMTVVEEFSYRETAEILSVPIGTVMSRLHRARNELRKLLMTSTVRAQAADPRPY